MNDAVNSFCLKLYVPDSEYDFLLFTIGGDFIDFFKKSDFHLLESINNYRVYSAENAIIAQYFDPLNPCSYENVLSENFSIILNSYVNKVFSGNSILHQSTFYSHDLLIRDVSLIDKQSKILNVACGNCFEEDIFKTPHDFSFSDIIDFKDKSSNFKICNAHHLDFEDNYFDYVWLFSFLEHSFNPYAIINESLKKIKRGGELWITIPVYNKPVENQDSLFIPIFHLQFFTKEGNVLGFNIIKLIEYLEVKTEIKKTEYFYFDQVFEEEENVQLLIQCVKK